MAKLVVPSLPLPSQGMMLDEAQHAIPEQFCFYSQDVLYDVPGKIRSRGVLSAPATPPASVFGSGARMIGITSLQRGTGDTRVLVVAYNGNFQFKVYQAESGTLLNTWDLTVDAFLTPGDIGSSPNYYLFDAKPAIAGGKLISINVSSQYSTSTNRPSVIYWRGASKNPYGTGTIAVTNGSPTVTGTGTVWTTNAEPGMFLYEIGAGSSKMFLGVVKTVNSDTSITLEGNVYRNTGSGLGYKVTPYRDMYPLNYPWVTNGTITTSTSSTTVTGGNTNWLDIKGGSPNYFTAAQMYRRSDFAYIGQVSTVNNNISITLQANAAVALNGEEYVIVPIGIVPSNYTGMIPTFHAFWNQYQWFGNWNAGRAPNNGYRAGGASASDQAMSLMLFLRGPDFIDEGDPSVNGTFIPIQPTRTDALSTAITGLAATTNSLLVFLENETHVIVGNNPDDFQSRQLLNDGCISAQSIVPYKNGVVWAGTDSIYYYDGVTVNDLLNQRAKNYYQTGTHSLSGQQFFYGAIIRDHYVLSPLSMAYDLSNTSTILMNHNVTSYTAPAGQFQWVFNLKTGALGTFSNVNHLGAAQAAQGQWMLFNQGGVGFLGAAVADGQKVFTDPSPLTGGQDQWITNNGNADRGPNFYFESRLYDMGNPELKKLFRQAQMWLLNANPTGLLNLDVFGNLTRYSLNAISTTGLSSTGGFNQLSNPSFETSTTGWDTAASFWLNAGASLTRSTGTKLYGAAAGFLVTDGVGAQEGARIQSVPVISGATVVFSAWVYRTIGSGNIGIGIGDGTFGQANSGWSVPNGTWTRIHVIYTPGGTGNTQAAIFFPGGAGVVNNVYIDGVKLEYGSTPTDYYEGDNSIAATNIRKKFLVRNTHLGMRIWSTSGTPDQGTQISALALGFKPMRPGRV